MGEIKETLAYFFRLFALLERRSVFLILLQIKEFVDFLSDYALIPSHMGMNLSSMQLAIKLPA